MKMFRHLACGSMRQCRRNYQMRDSKKFDHIKQNILRETKVSTTHLTPEIALHLITNECRLFNEPVTAASENVFANDPFWGFYWPGGQALSRYILDNPQMVSGKSVLDVGSGCGASSLAALMCQAKYAIANDIDEAAACAALLNGQLNNIDIAQLQLCAENLIGTPVREELIFLGDIFYDEEIANILLPWLQSLRKAGKTILIGDPGRHGLTANRLSFMKKLSTYELPENCCIENNGFKFVNVWRVM